MRALTLWQPWAHAIIHCGKRVENRPWAPPLSMLGQRIAIHAGKGYSSKWPFPVGVDMPSRKSCAQSAVLGVATLLGWQDTRPGAQHRLADVDGWPLAGTARPQADPWWIGPVGWLLGDVRAVEPIPCRGALGLWTLPPDVEAALAHALSSREQ